jgi:isochorismate pyruvate lyase
MTEAEQCRTMGEVRASVDRIDQQVLDLLTQRFRFMEAAARIKPNRDAVRDERRKAEIIARVRRAAQDAGIPDEVIADLYDRLIEGSIAYELAWFDAMHGDHQPCP